MGEANDSAARFLARRPCRREASSLTDRTRLALLFVVLVATLAARVGGALGAPTDSALASTAATDAKIVAYARQFVGVRYSYGGTSPATGFDCSGFTRFVYAHFGIDLPHYSGSQFQMGRAVSQLRPGDLVFFDGLGHVGLYVGGGRFIHAPHSGARVSIDTLAGHGSFVGARRLF
jgi:cell wall-associated NlpC family hydrolase